MSASNGGNAKHRSKTEENIITAVTAVVFAGLALVVAAAAAAGAWRLFDWLAP